MAEKIGVYVCHCGSNIAGRVDVEEVAKWAGEHIEGVVVARDYKFMCSDLGQKMVEEDIKKEGLTRVVVAACSPHLHEKTFRRACANGGLNPYLLEMTNIREHCSWVHKDPAAATVKAKSLVSAAARAGQVPGTARADVSSMSTRRRWSWAAVSPVCRPRSNWPTPATRSCWWNVSRRSAATWRSSTRRFPRWIARPAF